MILVIDNYDSFTFNVVQSISEATDEKIEVVRNDECNIEKLAAIPETTSAPPFPL